MKLAIGHLFSDANIKIDEKEILKTNNKNVIKVVIKVAALEYQAVLDDVKVQIDHKKLEDWIKHSSHLPSNRKYAVEHSFLYPSTHFILVPYRNSGDLRDSYVKDPDTGFYFTENQLILMAENMFKFSEMVGNGTLDSYFVLHTKKALDALDFSTFLIFEGKSYTYKNYSKNKDIQSLPRNENSEKKRIPADELKPDSGCCAAPDVFDRIRAYYGEQVALYFRFATHMSKWTMPIGLIGVLCQAYIIQTMDFESPLLAVYAIFIIIWARLFTESWKRVELECVYRWGTDEFESKEETRFQYVKPTKITDDYVYGYDYEIDTYALLFKQTLSAFVIAFIMGCVLCTTILIYEFKSFLQVYFQKNGVPSEYSSTCASVLNTIQIAVFKFLYQIVATWLNDFENHRTVSEHEDSMITKLTIFAFFNTYISFFYIAFVAGSMAVYTDGDDDGLSNQCGKSGCMMMLAENLLIVLLLSLTSDKLLEFVVYPMLKLETLNRVFLCKCCSDEGSSDEHDVVIKNFNYPEYGFMDRLSDYSTLFTYFGYIVLFSPALPMAPFIVAVSTAFETRGDLRKLRGFRRAFSIGQDIGAWQRVFELITVAGVISNSAMVVFTLGAFQTYDFVTQMWIFISMQWLMFSLLDIGRNLITDVPYQVTIQRVRHEFYKATLHELHLNVVQSPSADA